MCTKLSKKKEEILVYLLDFTIISDTLPQILLFQGIVRKNTKLNNLKKKRHCSISCINCDAS